jgi:hypothetical protein
MVSTRGDIQLHPIKINQIRNRNLSLYEIQYQLCSESWEFSIFILKVLTSWIDGEREAVVYKSKRPDRIYSR